MDKAKEQKKLTAKMERLTACRFNLDVVKLYLKDISEVPDAIKNLPVRAQWAYVRTFNTNLRFKGDITWAIKAANKAARNMADYIEAEKRKAARPLIDRDTERKIEQDIPKIFKAVA